MFAEVIINSNARALNKTFDYIVPVNLEKDIKIGSRVFVPFGNGSKIDDGFVINHDKMIEQVVDSIEDKYIIVCQHGLCGVRNANSGEILIPCAFGDVVWIGKDKFAVEYNRKWAIYNSQMENLSGFVCDKIKPLDGKYITDTEHWVAIGEIESRFTYEWGYKYNYKWLSVDVEKLNKKH